MKEFISEEKILNLVDDKNTKPKDYTLANLFIKFDHKTYNFTGIDSRISFKTLKSIIRDIHNIDEKSLEYSYIRVGTRTIQDDSQKLIDYDIKSDTTIHIYIAFFRLNNYYKSIGVVCSDD